MEIEKSYFYTQLVYIFDFKNIGMAFSRKNKSIRSLCAETDTTNIVQPKQTTLTCPIFRLGLSLLMMSS